MVFKGRRITISGFGSEEVVCGQRVDLAAVGAAVFDFSDSYGLVAAVGEPSTFDILVRYEGCVPLTHPKLPRSKGNLDFSSSPEA